MLPLHGNSRRLETSLKVKQVLFLEIMTRLIQKTPARKKPGLAHSPKVGEGKFLGRLGFVFCVITHPIEFNYLVVKFLQDKCLLVIYRHFPCVITFFLTFFFSFRRNRALGNVQSKVGDESHICQMFSWPIFLHLFYVKNQHWFWFFVSVSQATLLISSSFQWLLLGCFQPGY